MSVKQVIILRKDLNMRKGKMVAQGAHASLKAILDEGLVENSDLNGQWYFHLSLRENALREWIEGSFKKVCVSVDSEEQLIDLYNKAKERGMICSLILDSGLTEFDGIATYTAVAIGPDYDDKIDELTGNLKLL
jgi:PTH2 family peptidyl-tRNA hydrolase